MIHVQVTLEAVEFATLEWVDWFNNRRLLEPIGNVPPVKYELEYYRIQEAPAMVADSRNEFSGNPGAVHVLSSD